MEVAIGKVIQTLVEAVVLVFLVMWLFLQNLRYTLIPTIVVPVCLAGTLAVMYALGFSVNMMTMFGMVLAIGILVDDAIVVVENVERLMAEEGLSPLAATVKAMQQVSGAIVGITLVLVAVFLPLAFMSGSVGVIYRQFSLSLAVSSAVRHAAQACCRGSPRGEERPIRLVQPPLCQADRALFAAQPASGQAHRPLYADLCSHRGRAGLCLHAHARVLCAL